MTDGTRNAILVGATTAFLLAIGHLYWQVDRMARDMGALRQSVVDELTKVRSALPVVREKVDKKQAAAELARLEQMRQEIEARMDETRDQVRQAAALARSDAVSHAARLIQQLGQEHATQQKEVVEEIGNLRSGAGRTTERVEQVNADVADIRTQVATARQELERTVNELKRVNGDLGVQSGLIATNARELAALKELGERHYYEFDISRKGAPQRIGEVSVVLRKADPKSQRFSIEVIAGDQRTEKKDKSLNEPVQFYLVRGARLPHEIVVNEVRKDEILGYLAAPKPQVPARNLE